MTFISQTILKDEYDPLKVDYEGEGKSLDEGFKRFDNMSWRIVVLVINSRAD